MDRGGASLVVGVLREDAQAERRVALTPEVVGRVQALGLSVLVERGAGERALYVDDDYTSAGAVLATREELLSRADVLLGVRAPDRSTLERLRPRQALLGMLRPDRASGSGRCWSTPAAQASRPSTSCAASPRARRPMPCAGSSTWWPSTPAVRRAAHPCTASAWGSWTASSTSTRTPTTPPR
jgi:hypothetical protein